MNKFLKSSVLILAICAAVCGCTNESGNSSSDTSNSAPTSSSSAPTSSEVSSVADSSTPENSDTGSSDTSAPSTSEVHADLTGTLEAVSSTFECSNGWSNGSMFNCTWRKNNVIFSDGSMKLKIDLDGNGEGAIPYSGGEFRSKGFYGYGMYEVVMKPIKNDGVVSSFFTYTGPSDQNPWDEIDIEFLGKDTTSVQFNYFTNGKGSHEHVYKLGFDASEEFHTYGFDWQADKITWYVDGEAVYTAEKDIPSTPGKIMMNVWPGKGVDGWLKAFDGTVPLTAEYKSVDFKS